MSTTAITGYASRSCSTSKMKQAPGIKAPSSSTGSAFVDNLDSYNAALWDESNWANGVPFNCAWAPNHINFQNEKMTITLDNQPSFGKPYTSGEYRTKDFYGYGTLEARIKVAVADGVVGGSLFFYTGPSDGNPRHEIDIEFVKDKLQINYATNGVGCHETVIDLGFDPSQDFHTYKIEWLPDKITWFVDEKPVHSEDGSRGPLPSIPGRIIANLWAGDSSIDGWLGHFNYTSPLTAEYDWIKYTPESDDSTHLHDNTSSGAQPFNYPNPFKTDTTIRYQLESDCDVTIKICNIAGELVRTLELGTKSAGVNTELWDGKNSSGNSVASGVYLIILRTGGKKPEIIRAAKIN